MQHTQENPSLVRPYLVHGEAIADELMRRRATAADSARLGLARLRLSEAQQHHAQVLATARAQIAAADERLRQAQAEVDHYDLVHDIGGPLRTWVALNSR